MTENAIFSLVGQSPFVLGQTHRFAPGPLYGSALNLDSSIDVYAFVRFNNGFTPSELIQQYMTGWTVKEDQDRHSRWHGRNATWFDVLTNKISVDRSSVGNALYLVLNLATKGAAPVGKNYAKIDEWALTQKHRSQDTQQSQPIPSPQNAPSMDAQTLYQMQMHQLQQQQQQQQQFQQAQPQMQMGVGLGISQPNMQMGMLNMPNMAMQNPMNSTMGMGYVPQNMGNPQSMQMMMNMMPNQMMMNPMVNPNTQMMGNVALSSNQQMMGGAMLNPSQQMMGNSMLNPGQQMMANSMMNTNAQMMGMQGTNPMNMNNQMLSQMNQNHMQNQMNPNSGYPNQ
jgi:hypothetical protein